MCETVDAQGVSTLWLGAWQAALVRWTDPPNGPVAVIRSANSDLPLNEVVFIRQFDDADGRRCLWVGTTRGLAWRDLDDEDAPWNVLTTTTDPPLPGEFAYQMEQDARGRFYVLTDKGVVRLERRSPAKVSAPDFSAHTFTTEDGLPSLDGMEASMIDSLGRIWFGTAAGLAILDPAFEIEDRTPKRLLIERVTIGGEPCNLVSRGPLSWHENTLEFEFALLSYFREGETQYQSQLVGFDRKPSVWTQDYRRNYTNLPAGRYVFRVWGRDYAGNVSGPTEAAFEIRTAPWKTWWAYTFYAGAAAAAAYAGVRQRVRSLERRSEELEALVEQRTAELSESEQRALEANRGKSAFLANMSHELRTPLNAVLGFAELMSRNKDRLPEDLESLEIIKRSGEHLLGLIDDVLSLSKIEAGRLTLAEQSFDLRRLVDSVERIIRARAEAKALDLRFAVAPDLPAVVTGDEGKLRQVLINLLGNAVKFTDEGSVTLRAGWANGRAAFEVEDTGRGVGETELAALFEPFVQTKSGRDAKEGTGLGLAISRQIVRLMGGDIMVHSLAGRGTAFYFEIDLPVSERRDDRPFAPRVRSLAPGLRPPRILIADDVAENRLLLMRMLSSVGFEVREVSNGREAVAAWETWRPHLIVMDMRMPVMDGWEATRRIRAEEMMNEEKQKRNASGIHHSSFIIHHSTKIVALTAFAFDHERESILASGADEFLTKPFRERALFDVLAKQLNVRFVFDDAGEPVASPSRSDDEVLTAERLEALPRECLQALREGGVAGDVEVAARVANGIRDFDEPLANALLARLRSYRIDELFDLLTR
jgi:signal transduction histidine kinase/CheY-like chemotaxis protein